jgi:hypothetical protein
VPPVSPIASEGKGAPPYLWPRSTKTTRKATATDQRQRPVAGPARTTGPKADSDVKRSRLLFFPLKDFRVTEFKIETRHYCRNPKCRSKLTTPVVNPREAFCCRGCHSGF